MPALSFSTAICPECHGVFNVLRSNMVYCSPTCRRRAARHKEAEKNRVPVASLPTVMPNVHSNPTVEQLNAAATSILSGLQIEPMMFTGAIPTWTIPPGLSFIPTHDNAGYVLQRAAFDGPLTAGGLPKLW